MGFSGKRAASQREDDESDENGVELAQLKEIVGDRSSAYYLVKHWDAYRKRISNLVNHVTVENVKLVAAALLKDNMYDGAGVFVSSCLKAQMVAPPEMTPVFAALVAKLNSSVHDIGHLVLKRLLMHWRRALRRNDRHVLLKATKFLAHLLNQQVAKETLALEIVTRLLAEPTTDDKVECAVGFVQDVGRLLRFFLHKEIRGIIQRLLEIMYDGGVTDRVQIMIEELCAHRKAKFQDFPAKIPELDLLAVGECKIHEVTLDDELEIDEESTGAHFFGTHNPSFMDHDRSEYESIIHENLVNMPLSDVDLGFGDYCNNDDDEEEDRMDTGLIRLRRAICGTLSKCVSIEKSGFTLDLRHPVLNVKVQPGQELELWVMLIEFCGREETYSPYYARVAESLCWRDRNLYQGIFERCFPMQVALVSRMDNNKLRNVAEFFGYLVGKGSILWEDRLSKEATDPSSRLFIDLLFEKAIGHMRLDASKVKAQQEHVREPYTNRSMMPCTTEIQHQAEHVKVDQQVLPPQPEESVDEEDMEEDVEEDMEYEVEAILSSKTTSKRGKQYLVKWKGYETDEATWEPAAALTNAREAVQEFETAKRQTKRQRIR
jgi:pre-mRNA-splicing factor CWC22